MSDKMYPIPFGEMINWILSEYKKEKSIFGVHKLYKKNDQQTLSIFGEMLETPFGPAAGPHNQLAQNIICLLYTSSFRMCQSNVHAQTGHQTDNPLRYR